MLFFFLIIIDLKSVFGNFCLKYDDIQLTLDKLFTATMILGTFCSY